MATDFFAQKDDEENKQQNPAQQLSGESGVITGNDPSQTQSIGQNGEKQSASGSFTNLNQYLDANKSLGFGGQVADKVGGEISSAETAQNQADTGFRGQVDSSAVKKDQSLLDSVHQDPTKVAQDEAQAQAFAKMRDANYQGPNNLSDTSLYQPAQQQTQKAAEVGALTTNESGRKTYLNQEYGAKAGRYNYTGGQQKLDNLLIQQDPDAKAAFEANSAKAATLNDRFSNLSNALNEYAGQAKTGTQDARNSTRSLLGIDDNNQLTGKGDLADASNPAKQRAQQLQQQRDAEIARLEGALGGRSTSGLSTGDLAKLGVTQGASLFNIDPNRYFSGNQNINANTVATPEEQARVAALSKLGGIENTLLPYADQAGTQANAPLYDFNKANFLDEISRRNNAMNSELNSTMVTPLGGGTIGGVNRQIPLQQAYQQAYTNFINSGGHDMGAKGAADQYMAQINEIKARHGYNDRLK